MIYRGKRIGVEFFHALTDGTGGMVFLKTLIGEYLRLKGVDFLYGDGVLDPAQTCRKEEHEDGFLAVRSALPPGGMEESTALAVPLVLTADVIFISVLLLFSSFRKTKNTLRLSYVFFAAAAECVSLGMAIGLSFFAAYLLVGISMIFCVSVLTVYRKELKSELRWRIFGKGKQDDIREQE